MYVYTENYVLFKKIIILQNNYNLKIYFLIIQRFDVQYIYIYNLFI